MRMVVNLALPGELPVVLPVHYNHWVQAALYRSISPELSGFLHEQGYLYGKRSFKLFTFSRLLGRWERRGDRLYFYTSPRLFVSSPVDRFIRELANTLLHRGHITFGSRDYSVQQVTFPKEPVISSPMRIRMLAPVTVYSTLYTRDGRRKTYYYSPKEPEFSEQVEDNLKKKGLLLTSRRYKSDFRINPDGGLRESVMYFKDTVIKGWVGRFTLRGPKMLLRIGYETGIGSKNPQGFGMFEVIT